MWNLRGLPYQVFWRITRRVVWSLTTRFGEELYATVRATLDEAAAKSFRSQVIDLGPSCFVQHPIYLKNPRYFQIGSNFNAKAGLRLEAYDLFEDECFTPHIRIGNNVCLNYNVHIGAINRIEIADNVLIGSHVLITDHAHGGSAGCDLAFHPAARPLKSKGSVVIEEGVWIGEGACILPGVRVGRRAVIGANAVVTSAVAPETIIGGVPAKPIRLHREYPKLT
jgi:acetyltransferase-like isoleucine patch superfamily enzyme